MLAGTYYQPVSSGLLFDAHLHAKLSKKFDFEAGGFWQKIWQARRVGLDGFALTEHFHTVGFWAMYEDLLRRLPYRNGVLKVGDHFRILTGAELGVAEGCDILMLGTLDQLVSFDRSLHRPASAGYKPPFDEAAVAAQKAGIFLIGAHMYRPKKELAKLGDENVRRLNALELNGKDFFNDELVGERARVLDKPLVGGSDAHYWPQVGIKATLLPIADITQESVTEAIGDGRSQVVRLSHGPVLARFSSVYKRIVKAKLAQEEDVNQPTTRTKGPLSIAQVTA